MGLPVTCSFLFGPETNEQMVDDFEAGVREREEYECEAILYPKHGLCPVIFFSFTPFFIPFLCFLSAHFISRCLCHCLGFVHTTSYTRLMSRLQGIRDRLPFFAFLFHFHVRSMMMANRYFVDTILSFL